MFAKLGRWCHDHKWTVVGIWVAALVLGSTINAVVGTNTKSEFELPDVESRRGTQILEEHFGGEGAGFGGRIVFATEQDLTDPAVHGPLVRFLAEVDAIDPTPGDDVDDVRVRSPFDPGNARQISSDEQHAGKIAYAEVELPSNYTLEEAAEVKKAVDEVMPRDPAIDVILGGQVFAEFEPPNSEALGLAFAMVILLLAFGSVLAMGLPIGVALFGIGAGTVVAGFLSHLVSPPDFASILGIMIGLGVGIDYALFIVTRFRENLHRGYDVRESTAIALDTAGRAVLFAGTTVVISLLGMIIMGMSFVTGLAVNAASVVALTMVASLTLLPALLALAGPRVEITRYRGLVAAGFVAVALIGAGLVVPALIMAGAVLALATLVAGFAVAPLKREVRHRDPKPIRETAAYRWSRTIQRHPWVAVIGGAAFLLVLATPVLGLRLGFSDEGNFPEGTDTREAYDLLAEGFGPGFNGPLVVASEVGPEVTGAQLYAVTEALQADPNVAVASPPVLSGAPAGERGEGPGDPSGGPPTPAQIISGLDETLGATPRPQAVIFSVIPATAPQDAETTALVHRLREDVVPAATEGSTLDPAVSGFVAVAVDFSDYLASRLPYFLGAVLALSFLLLMVVFRSILVPIKAVIMNLLSIGAAYGVVVAIFQWGWGKSLFGIDSAPIEPFMPMMLFAIVFGLSMDYEVFLLSRVKEEWDRTGDSRESVADGLAATALVITAAALIMVFVFGSFLMEDDRVIKLMGTGLATAIFIDATIVRMLLVPATMELLGDLNWWLPRWLDRLLPRIDVEGHPPPPEPDVGDTAVDEDVKEPSAVD